MKNCIKKYWLCVEPSVFIFKEKNCILFYDSNSSIKLIFECAALIEDIVDKLNILNNMYCIAVDECLLDNKDVRKFVKSLRDNYMADLFPYSDNSPIVIPPITKCHADKPWEDSMFSEGTDVMTILNTITFYLNGKCNQSCKSCSEYYKQFECCYKNEGELSINDIIKMVDHVTHTSISNKINFNGGNVFLYSHINQLFDYLVTEKIKSNLYFNYLNWTDKFKEHILSGNVILHIFITAPINKTNVYRIIRTFDEKPEILNFIFIVKDEQELFSAQDIISDLNIQQYLFKPFYDGNNITFFENAVYTTIEEIESINLTKQDIFKHQRINLFDIGKLSLTSSGKYYSNFNFETIGSVEDDLVQLVGKEWISGKSWKRIRSGKPCNDCIYQYLCPSPSNYEIVIGRNNLCNIK